MKDITMKSRAVKSRTVKSRLGLYLPFIVLASVAAIWSGIWYYAASKTEVVITETLTREAQSGRQWTCPNRRVSGFPFRIEVNCDAPTFTSKQEGKSGSGTLAGLSVQARVADPTRAIAVLKSPFKLEAENGSITIDWQDARTSLSRTSLSSSNNSLGEFSLDISQVNISAKPPNSPPLSGTISRMNINLAQDTDMDKQAASSFSAPFKFLAKLDGIAFAPFDTLSGNAHPLNLELQLRATHVPFKPLASREAALEIWRQAGGSVSLALLELNKGTLHLDAKGDLSLDEEHKPAGKIALNFQGLEKIFAQLGAPGLGAFGSSNKLSLNLKNGKVLLGPIPVSNLQALY